MSVDASTLGTLLGTLTQGDAAPLVKGLAEVIGSIGGDSEGKRALARRRRRSARRLRDALHRLHERNQRLAQALGACECWGEDPDCPSCGGQGQAGCYEPDREAFAALVAPLMRSRVELVQTYLDAAASGTRPAV